MRGRFASFSVPPPLLLVVIVGRVVLVLAVDARGVAQRCAARSGLDGAPEERALQDGRSRAGTAIVPDVLGVVHVLKALAMVVAHGAHPGVVGGALGAGARGLLLTDHAAARMALQAVVDALPRAGIERGGVVRSEERRVGE